MCYGKAGLLKEFDVFSQAIYMVIRLGKRQHKLEQGGS